MRGRPKKDKTKEFIAFRADEDVAAEAFLTGLLNGMSRSAVMVAYIKLAAKRLAENIKGIVPPGKRIDPQQAYMALFAAVEWNRAEVKKQRAVDKNAIIPYAKPKDLFKELIETGDIVLHDIT